MGKEVSSGLLDYSVKDGYHRLVVLVDPELHRLFRSLVPRYYVCRPQKYPPHITVVRGEQPRTDEWGKYQGSLVEFTYDPWLFHDGVYWWFNCWSDFLVEVRLGLGLPSSYHLTRPPDGAECFHSTIGNSK
jgi:hypothetical protein